MRRCYLVVIALLLFVGATMLPGCGGSGSSPATSLVADKTTFPAASDTGLANGLSVACLNPVVAAHNPNCIVAEPKCIDPYGNPIPCDESAGKVVFPAASDTGLANGLAIACAKANVAAHNPNCVPVVPGCTDPYGNPIPCE